MTNKVKPFYIRITDDTTPQMVQDALDKCVDAGAVANDGCKSALSNNKYRSNFDINNYGAFGVRFDYGTYIEVNSSYFGEDAQEITLDQLDEWLGLKAKLDWKNGDECKYLNSPVEHYFIGLNPLLKSHCYISSNDGYVNYVKVGDLSKPETPEQKSERERLEAAYDLYCNAQHAVDVIGYDNFGVFKSDKVQVKFWLSIVDKTGYRKQ